jgi:hypothetical protein
MTLVNMEKMNQLLEIVKWGVTLLAPFLTAAILLERKFQ